MTWHDYLRPPVTVRKEGNLRVLCRWINDEIHHFKQATTGSSHADLEGLCGSLESGVARAVMLPSKSPVTVERPELETEQLEVMRPSVDVLARSDGSC
jgi:hypothetical protein